MNPPENWFCCLNPTERNVFRFTALNLPVTLFVGIPLPIWTAYWFPVDPSVGGRGDAFQRIYHLQTVTLSTDEGDIEVVAPEDGFLPLWVDNSLFIVTPASACLGGCPLSVINPL